MRKFSNHLRKLAGKVRQKCAKINKNLQKRARFEQKLQKMSRF